MKEHLHLCVLMLSCLILIITISSCKDEPTRNGCTDVDAENYDSDANQDDGSCTYAREKFIGSFQSNSICDNGMTRFYTMNIKEAPASVRQVRLSNFSELGESGIIATVFGDNLSFNETILGVDFSGTGSLNVDTLTIEYTASNGVSSETCSITGVR